MQNSAINSSFSNKTAVSFFKPNTQMVFVQVLVGIFLYVNCLMIYTFLKKEVFREDTRYILFAQTLLVDSAFMVLSDVLLIGAHLQYAIHMIPCLIICSTVAVLSVCTPLTLVAMCLERYVAICMPLRHADISTRRTRFLGLLIIWAVSYIIPLFSIIAYLCAAPYSALVSSAVCSVEIMLEKDWQAQARAVILLLLFILMVVVIIFTYIKIMNAARAATSDNGKSKGLRTVVLHAVQLTLCIMQFLTPYIEMPLWKVDVMVFVNVRYSNFIVFIIAPHCLSPLIYGLRDKKFFLVLRHNAMCGVHSLLLVLITQVKITPN